MRCVGIQRRESLLALALCAYRAPALCVPFPSRCPYAIPSISETCGCWSDLTVGVAATEPMSAGPVAIARGYLSHPAWLGALVALEVGVGLGLARLGVRFDGFMDVHRTRLGQAVPPGVAIADQAAAIIIPLIVVMALIRVWGTVSDSVDSAAVAVVARLPVLVVGGVILWMPLPASIAGMELEAAGSLQPALVLPALIAVICVVAGFTLLVAGIRRSTGARGYGLAMRSIAVFLLAEIAGKLMLQALGYQS